MLQRVKAWILSPWVYRLVRLIVGVVFIVAGVLKLLDVAAFSETIRNFNLVPYSMANFVALFLPILEVMAGVGLVLDLKGSLSAILAMLLAFVAILWFGIVQDLNIDCGCFSPEEQVQKNSLAQAFYRDLVLMGMVGYLFFWRRIQQAEKVRPGFFHRIQHILFRRNGQ